MRSRSSSNRFHESQALPLGSVAMVPSACSNRHQSVLTPSPSIWYAEVAVPHRKSSGKRTGWSDISSTIGRAPELAAKGPACRGAWVASAALAND
jgi:hypothetical protein